MPKFVLLMVESDRATPWEEADDAYQDSVFAAFAAFDLAVSAEGEVLAGEALAPSSSAVTVREPGSGGRSTSDGPATSSFELGGFYVIEAADLNAAVRLAGELPQDYDIEVRPVAESPE